MKYFSALCFSPLALATNLKDLPPTTTFNINLTTPVYEDETKVYYQNAQELDYYQVDYSKPFCFIELAPSKNLRFVWKGAKGDAKDLLVTKSRKNIGVRIGISEPSPRYSLNCVSRINHNKGNGPSLDDFKSATGLFFTLK